MSKIVHIAIFERYCEGYAYQENLLAQKHKELGNDVYIIASQDSADNKKNPIRIPVNHYINKQGVDVTILPTNIYSQRLFSLYSYKCKGLYKRLEEICPDIIFVHNFTRKDVLQIVRYAKRHPNVRVYADCHSDYYNTPRNTPQLYLISCFVRLWSFFLNKVVVKFWGTTPWRVEYLQNIYKIESSKTDLLIMGADEKYIESKNKDLVRTGIRSEYKIPDDAFLIVTGGILDKRKQQELLAEAVRQLADSKIWLIMFGVPTDEMKAIYDSYSSEDNIVLTGWIPSEKAYDLFLASDLAFFPGTHSVLWEQAVACGTPLVVRKWHGMEHVNVNGNALLLDTISVDDIKTTIVALNNTKCYQDMMTNASSASKDFYLINIAKKAVGLE